MKVVILIFLFLGFGVISSYAQTPHGSNFDKGLIIGFQLASESKEYNPKIPTKYCKAYAVQQFEEGSAYYQDFVDGCLEGYNDGFGK